VVETISEGNMKATLGSLLDAHIKASGVTRQHLSDTSKVPVETISRIVNGHRLPSAPTLSRLSKALKLSEKQTGRLLLAA